MAPTNQRLDEIRQEIDAIDEKILQLIEQRAALAIEVAAAKRKSSENPVYYQPAREAQVLRKRLDNYQGLLAQQDVAEIYRAIMTACLALQQRQQVAFLGPEGTFSQASVYKHFGNTVDTLAVDSIAQVFQSVEKKEVNYGVVPFENSTTGIIEMTLDLLLKTSMHICGEILLPIHQNLLHQNGDIAGITRIYAHEQSLLQCKAWLDAHIPDNVERIAVSSNGYAASLAAQDANVAAVAGELAAQTYNLKVVNQHIEDDVKNTTRFMILGYQKALPSGNDKTSLLIMTDNKSDALIKLMQPFTQRHINVLAIESRPHRHRMWDVVVFLEVEGHQQDEGIQAALAEITQQPIGLTILGSYPKAVV